MRNRVSVLLSVAFLLLSATACGDNRQGLIEKACGELKAAWDNDGLDRRFQYYEAAADTFRELSAIDSGFAKFAARANEAANNSITDYKAFYEMIDFCGLD